MRKNAWQRVGRICVVPALALWCLTVGGCSSTTSSNAVPQNSSASGDVPAVSEVPRLLNTLDLRLPLDRYLPSLHQVDQRSTAYRILTVRCLKRFDVHVMLPEPPTGVGLRSQNERRYGLTDAAAAARLGYGLGHRDPRAHADERQEAQDLKPRALAVLTGDGAALPAGVPNGGCRGAAQHRLTPVSPATGDALDEDLPQRLSLETFQRSQRDPRVRAANADWSSCMRAQGHHYQNPLDPPADPDFERPGGALERETAKDDVACKKSTNLVGRWYAIESAYQNILIKKHHRELTQLARAERVTNAHVNEVLQ